MDDRALARLATTQHGVVSIAQLHGLGLTTSAVRKRVESGRLHRIHHGVYVVGVRRLSAKGRWLGAVLACGEGAALSHRAAAALHGVRARPRGPIDVTAAHRGRRRQDGIRVHTSRRDVDVTVIDGIRVTSVARTLLDLGAVLDDQALRHAVEAAERLGLFDLAAIQRQRTAGHPGATRLHRAIAAAGGEAPWTRSEFERSFLSFLRDRGLREPQANVLVCGELVDFFWPHASLVVETDSWRFHRSHARFEADRRRDAIFTVAGIRTLRVSDGRFHRDPDGVERDLRSLL